MPTVRIKYLIAVAGLAVGLALAAVTLTSGAGSGAEAAKQRVAIVSEGVENASGGGEFVLTPLQAGAVKRDSGTGRAAFSDRVGTGTWKVVRGTVTQPACERIACERVGTGPIRNCTPPTSAYRQSFADATVQDIAINGKHAVARFSNGETIELEHVNGYAVGGVWWIHKVGGNAGGRVFEAADRRLPPAAEPVPPNPRSSTARPASGSASTVGGSRYACPHRPRPTPDARSTARGSAPRAARPSPRALAQDHSLIRARRARASGRPAGRACASASAATSRASPDGAGSRTRRSAMSRS